ncbi:uncharacterized protein LOC123676814 isoform X2 [Harmonia axyridis]|uniref:uncharacterized protein LOC123676814 isoform X2 n=1 Tax=Harmonia axyridis TaxID=115357 RepID=UPI001E2763CD|nr:uncharacterized protein LOC123676814 isoform X2 [Harmonia axyridis]
MVAKVFLLTICAIISTESSAENYERFQKLEDFPKVNINNTLVYLQEDPIFFARLFSDLMHNIEPFVRGLMGYNRLKIGKLANETLHDIENIINGTTLNKRRRRCFDENKRILLLIYQNAASDWQCMKIHMIKLFDIIVPLWETLFSFTIINDAECGLNPFCLLSKGVDTAKLSTEMLEHGASIMSFGADFVLDTRICQKEITPFQKISTVILENFRICALIP